VLGFVPAGLVVGQDLELVLGFLLDHGRGRGLGLFLGLLLELLGNFGVDVLFGIQGGRLLCHGVSMIRQMRAYLSP
jgi:hypothetical protein